MCNVSTYREVPPALSEGARELTVVGSNPTFDIGCFRQQQLHHCHGVSGRRDATLECTCLCCAACRAAASAPWTCLVQARALPSASLDQALASLGLTPPLTYTPQQQGCVGRVGGTHPLPGRPAYAQLPSP